MLLLDCCCRCFCRHISEDMRLERFYCARPPYAVRPQVASSLDDLASALLFWRDDEYTEVKAVTLLPEAETLAARSLAISSASLGPDHPMTAGRQHNLGMVKRGQGREEEAR